MLCAVGTTLFSRIFCHYHAVFHEYLLGFGAVVDAQNVLTEGVLAQCDSRDRFKALMTQLYDYPRFGWASILGTSRG